MYRNELKFLINARQKCLLENRLSKLCQRDHYSDAQGGYWVSSLYFDDYRQSAFFDKLKGLQERRKFRIRIYNHQDDVIKLERKIKRGYVTEKSHIRLSREEYEALISGDVGFLRQKDDDVAREFYISYQTRYLRPRVVVEYRREAFVYRYGDVRVTLDSFLSAGVFQNDLFSKGCQIAAMPPEQIILEVKYTGYFPDAIRNIVQVENIHRQSISKYAKCFVVSI